MVRLFIHYWIWHYSSAFQELFKLSKNFVGFIVHLFSIRDLFHTLFYPWQRLGEPYRGKFNLSGWFQTFIINMLMRVVGFLVRSAVILVGLIAIIGAVALSFLALLLWILIPVIIVFLFVSSIRFFLHKNTL